MKAVDRDVRLRTQCTSRKEFSLGWDLLQPNHFWFPQREPQHPPRHYL